MTDESVLMEVAGGPGEASASSPPPTPKRSHQKKRQPGDPPPKPRTRTRPPPTGTPRKPPTPKAMTDAAKLKGIHEIVTLAVAGVCLVVPPEYHPTTAEVDGIFQPLERIYARRATIPEVSPDVADATAAAIAAGSFGLRIVLARADAARRHQSARTHEPASSPYVPPSHSTGGNGATGPGGSGQGNRADEQLANLWSASYVDAPGEVRETPRMDDDF